MAEIAWKLGETKSKMFYTGMAFVYFSFATSLSYLFYISFYLNTFWLILLTITAAKNGASYYFGYFAWKYEGEM